MTVVIQDVFFNTTMQQSTPWKWTQISSKI